MTEGETAAGWDSRRFGKRVYLTHHAAKRMAERALPRRLVEDLIETGAVKRKDDAHWWVYKSYPDRTDNLICAAVLCRQALIVKTLMNHWEEGDP